MHKSYNILLFFSVSKVLSLHHILKVPVFSANKMIQEIGFLFENSPKAIRSLRTAAEVSYMCINHRQTKQPRCKKVAWPSKTATK